jgi:hypothetical protein
MELHGQHRPGRALIGAVVATVGTVAGVVALFV